MHCMVSMFSGTPNYIISVCLTALLILVSAGIVGSIEIIQMYRFNTFCNKISQYLSICVIN